MRRVSKFFVRSLVCTLSVIAAAQTAGNVRVDFRRLLEKRFA